MDDNRSCEFCYYEHFDGKAYPCSMCINGEERTDKFEPKGRQTKQTEPTIEDSSTVEQIDFLEFLYNVINPNDMEKYKEMYESLDIATNGEQTDCPWK